MKSVVLPLVIVSFFLAAVSHSMAQLSAQMQQSTVRIICPEPAENGARGFAMVTLELSSGGTASLVGNSKGTGFIINNDGFIVTNNHVVATEPEKEVANPLVMVMQEVGNHYILHRARVLWQSANADLAVIQATNLKATPLPLLFDETKSIASEEVFSMGFPGIADSAEEDSDRSKAITIQLINIKINKQINHEQSQLRRALTKSEIENIKQYVVSHQESMPADWMDFLAALDAFLKNVEEGSGAWDVTDVIAHKNLWSDYFKPTVTKGNIERIAKIHGFLGVSYPDVMMIQHSCAIKHGNSGGPLLNAGGQVIGVVGRGKYRIKSGERESVTWATGISELKNWLDLHGVPYVAAGDWKKPVEVIEKEPVKIIEQLPTQIIQQPTIKIVEHLPRRIVVAVALAVLVAVAAAVLGLVKYRQRPGFTTMLRDPRMAKLLGTTPSKLLDEGGGSPRRTSNGPPPGFGKWQLTGRTPDGAEVCLEMTDVMFASNDYRLILGRTAELCHVVVSDKSVSKQHAHIRKDGDRFLVADRNSSNRTAVNGQFNNQVFEEVPFAEGDTLTFGDVRLEFSKV